MGGYNYFTCQELVDLHSKTVNLLRWNASKIGTFYNCFLLDGKTFGKNRRIIITEQSFTDLLTFAYNSLSIKEERPEYMSYEDVIEKIPQAEFYRWTPTVIGVFFHSGLLDGKRSHEESRNLVTKKSVVDLINYTNNRFINMVNKPIQ